MSKHLLKSYAEENSNLKKEIEGNKIVIILLLKKVNKYFKPDTELRNIVETLEKKNNLFKIILQFIFLLKTIHYSQIKAILSHLLYCRYTIQFLHYLADERIKLKEK